MSIGSWVFNGFDIVVLLVLFISLIMAGSRGLFRELISISALVFALVLTLFIWGQFRFTAQDIIQPGWLADGALGIGTFLLGYLLVVFVLTKLTSSLRGKEIKLFDRILGGGFGVLRGLIVMSLFVMFLTSNYREARDMRLYSESLTEEQRQVLENAPSSIREMISNEKEIELPAMLQNSTFYPMLDSIGGIVRSLPFGRFKTMGQQLMDGEDIANIIKGIHS